MKPNKSLLLGIITCTFALIISALLTASFAGAQQAQQPVQPRSDFYSLNRETVLQGTVIAYTPASTVRPAGAHVIVQTASGSVDVHVGNAKLLESRNFTLNPGDTLKIVGENLAYGDGTHFVARTIQKGSQLIEVRSVRGFVLQAVGANAPKRAGGVL